MHNLSGKIKPFFANYSKCTIFMEACGGSHYWGRQLKELGHEVKLIAPHKVRPFRKANKNDRNDAKACVQAGTCVGMEFVGIKEVWQQDILSLHRIRTRQITNQTALVNEMRGLLMEYGFTIPQGINNVRARVPTLIQDQKNALSPMLRSAIGDMHAELLTAADNIERLDKQLENIFKTNEVCQRLAMVEGVGPITATAIYASCPDPSLFKNGRQFAAWLGLTPGHTQTGGKESKAIMLGITKRGDSYLRSLLVQGGMASARVAKKKNTAPNATVSTPQEETMANSSEKLVTKTALSPARKRKKLSVSQQKPKSASRLEWLKRLIDEKGMQKAAVAMANRNARVLWALMKTGKNYDSQKGGGFKSVA